MISVVTHVASDSGYGLSDEAAWTLTIKRNPGYGEGSPKASDLPDDVVMGLLTFIVEHPHLAPLLAKKDAAEQ
ncbi:hypothetical protein HOT75_gp067 [Gordonia phage Daredevil]|uniref:Uncharacterized protein n=1 Tax=Gordonia phage Daredevil TaxID=2283286 RepID=A0A345MIS3_9CAUD|nr:hypothetical protein HOT75_gp067 [Gordonia phage Daredevil]AXH70454.1 hypothetical protein SEA_DAREDEVIL_67 [Gordonia phage Daredevil]